MDLEEIRLLIEAIEDKVPNEGAQVQLDWSDYPYDRISLLGNKHGLILLALQICKEALTLPQSDWKTLELDELIHENSEFYGIELGVDEKGYIEIEPTPRHIKILNVTLAVMFVIALGLLLAGKTKVYWWPLFH